MHPIGLVLDDSDNVIVSDAQSMYIHVLKKDGIESKYFERDPSVYTEIICYNKKTKTLLGRERQFVHSLKLKISEIEANESSDSDSE